MPRKSSFSVSKVLDVLGAGKTADEKRSEGVSIAVAVDSDAPRDLVAVVRDSLVSQQATAVVRVLSLADASGDAANVRDAVILLPGSNPAAAGEIACARARAGVPVALVAHGALDLPAFNDLPEEVSGLISGVVATDADRLADRLARWLLDATDKPIALAANFPFCRAPLVSSLAARCAAENAAVGAVDIVHGSDFPIMTANQMKLALDIAAAYGDELSPKSAVDIALVLASGLAWRAFARAVNGAPPMGTWASRAAFAFAGTWATSILIEALHDGTLSEAASRLSSLAVDSPREDSPSTSPVTLPAPLANAASDDSYIVY